MILFDTSYHHKFATDTKRQQTTQKQQQLQQYQQRSMNTNSMESTLAGMPARIHNYDVLLLPSTDGEPLRFAPGNHVGNQRFQVTLCLFRLRYRQAELFGHAYECASIANELLDVVCKKCVPNGRFFLKGSNGRWCQLFGDALSNIILNGLKNEPVETDCSERSPKRVCRRSVGFEPQHVESSNTLPAKDDVVASPNPFDVVCKADTNGKLSLAQDRQHTGNNRLKVVFDMRKRSYENSDREGKQRIAREVVSSIIDDASGHFLLSEKSSGTFKLVSRERAAACVKAALDAVADGERGRFRQAEVKKLVQRKHKKAIIGQLESRKRRSFLFFNVPPTSFSRLHGIASKAA